MVSSFINHLSMKRNRFYLKTQLVPRSKQSQSRVQKPVS